MKSLNEKLLHAVDINQLDQIKLLLGKGANPNATSAWGQSALMLACSNGLLAVTQLLIEHGADINYLDKNNQTALHIAVTKNINIVQYLIAKGAHIDQKDNQGRTALCLSVAKKQCLPITKLLVDSGADINCQTHNGKTPLMRSVSMPHDKQIAFLLNAGADVNIKDSAGRTALMLCFFSRWNEVIVDQLLEYGADISIQDNNGVSVIDIVRQKKITEAELVFARHEQRSLIKMMDDRDDIDNDARLIF